MREREYLYYAFISYKHQDLKWTRWLKHKLQAYRLPLRLCRQHADLDRRLMPIFYDVNLRPGELNEQIRQEIRASKYLIVICSRAAAESPHWLNDEIDFFLNNGGSRDRIIPVIVDESEHPEKEMFPSRLCELNEDNPILGVNVPVSGKRQSLLKIVSCMHGIRVEELESEDRKRRKRNALLAVTACIIFAAALTATVLVMRDLSISQRAAEADKWMVESASAIAEGRQQTAVESALNALNSGPDESRRLQAEALLAQSLHLYEQDSLYGEAVIKTEDYVRSISMTENGRTLIVDHGYSASAYDVYTLKKRWTLPLQSINVVGNSVFIRSMAGVNYTQIDPDSGNALREIDDEREAERLSASGSDNGYYAADHMRGSRDLTIKGEKGSVTLRCSSPYSAVTLLDGDRALFAGNREISVYTLSNGQKEEIVRLEDDLFRFPVQILKGRERILCILNGRFFCLDCYGNLLTTGSEGESHRQESGVIAAFWVDADETTAAWIGCDGRVSYAGGKHFYYCRQTNLDMKQHWVGAYVSSSHPEVIALKPETDPFAIHLYRLVNNPDAVLLANCVPEGFQYTLMHEGKYLLRSNSLDDEYSYSYDLLRVEDATVVWSYRGQTELGTENRGAVLPVSFPGLSQDTRTLYLSDESALRIDTGEIVLEAGTDSVVYSKELRQIMASNGEQPTVQVRVLVPKYGAPLIIVSEENEEVWHDNLPVPLNWTGTIDASLSEIGENGWAMILLKNDNGEQLPVLADLLGHRMGVCHEEVDASQFYRIPFGFGVDRENPVLLLCQDTLKIVSCTSGQTVRQLPLPTENERYFGTFVQNDRYLFLYSQGVYSVHIMDAYTGKTVFERKNLIDHFNGLNLTLSEDEKHIWYVLHDRLEGDLQDGYRIDTKLWLIDRHYPLADSFIPSVERVICMDEAELKRYSYPEYNREELKELAAVYLKSMLQD